MEKYNQPTPAPTSKVAAGGIAGAVITALLALANLFGIVIPEEVTGAALTLVAAVTTIISFAAAYIKRDVKPVEAIEAIYKDNYTDNLKG